MNKHNQIIRSYIGNLLNVHLQTQCCKMKIQITIILTYLMHLQTVVVSLTLAWC